MRHFSQCASKKKQKSKTHLRLCFSLFVFHLTENSDALSLPHPVELGCEFPVWLSLVKGDLDLTGKCLLADLYPCLFVHHLLTPSVGSVWHLQGTSHITMLCL
jgi:hypothetical protein